MYQKIKIIRLNIDGIEKAFNLVASLPEMEEDGVNYWKEKLDCGIVLKKDNLFYFVQEIEDAILIEKPIEEVLNEKQTNITINKRKRITKTKNEQ